MTDEYTPPAPPAELADRGAAFWSDLVDEIEFDRQSLERLRQVCRLLDIADRLQAAIDDLISLDIPDDDARSGYSRRALAAAKARWS
jgi:hypothetical protein